MKQSPIGLDWIEPDPNENFGLAEIQLNVSWGLRLKILVCFLQGGDQNYETGYFSRSLLNR